MSIEALLVDFIVNVQVRKRRTNYSSLKCFPVSFFLFPVPTRINFSNHIKLITPNKTAMKTRPTANTFCNTKRIQYRSAIFDFETSSSKKIESLSFIENLFTEVNDERNN